MRKYITLFSASIFCLILLTSHTFKSGNSFNISQWRYDPSISSADQPNPIFRWPLPQVDGDVIINAQFVLLNNGEDAAIDAEVLENSKEFLNGIFNPHGIYVHFKQDANLAIKYTQDLVNDWKSILPSNANQLTIYVFPENEETGKRGEYYASNDIVSDRFIIPYNNKEEFAVYTAKNIGYSLGLLPTYFESSFLEVEAENDQNCGSAGDFVCDTPFDHLGLKNDVKRRNCRFKGKVGSPDPINLMSNSWTECMSQITPGQANKIKYNVSVIPQLQSLLNMASTVELNIGQRQENLDNTINQLTLN